MHNPEPEGITSPDETTAIRSPYEIWEAKYGPYHPDKPQPIPYAVWYMEQKAEYLRQHPEAVKHQIDGHFFEGEQYRFFAWLDKTN